MDIPFVGDVIQPTTDAQSASLVFPSPSFSTVSIRFEVNLKPPTWLAM